MKSQRKHELQTNELADYLGRFIEQAKPHARLIGYGAAGVVALIVLLIVVPAIRGNAPSGADLGAAAFNQAIGSNEAQPLRDFLKDNATAAQAPAARLMLAGRILGEVVAGLKTAPGEDVKAKSAALLTEAKDLYEQAAKSAESEPAARVGLALVTAQQGDIEKARAALQEVVQKWPQSIAASQARIHSEQLASYQPVAFSDEPLEKTEVKPEAEPVVKPAAKPEAKAETKPEAKPETPNPAEAPKAPAAPTPKG